MLMATRFDAYTISQLMWSFYPIFIRALASVFCNFQSEKRGILFSR